MRLFLRIICLFFLSAAQTFSEEISVMSFNLCNYFVEGDGQPPIKPASSREAIGKILGKIRPDIFIAIEIGGEKSYADFSKLLKENGCEYKFQKIMQGDDSSRHMALFSKFEPKEFHARNDMKYKIKVKNSYYSDEIGVQRGILHSIFVFDGGYKLHLIGAHLKARVFHPRYNQTDMRRYEARILRYIVNSILEKEPDANVLVMGDFNDSFDSEPIRLLRDDKKENESRLYDLRPSDKWGMYWTHWWNQYDNYSRIDYALASYSILPEIDHYKTQIIHIPELWMFASDHRPILIVLNTKNSKEIKKEEL
ncbi:MAG TPA: endonuclease/exonuclease/phosphatase family protein, partial [Victivallales bacterium]|nr:endonuclease/exonuclease/phosphatase family protein [Victivallales bacterium]